MIVTGLRKNCAFSLLAPTSMGLRLTAKNRQPTYCSTEFMLQLTSAESNVLSVSSYLGLPVKILTKLIKDSQFTRQIKDNLASRHITVEAPEVPKGGPWGLRYQINWSDSGFGIRAPVVESDRTGEVGGTLSVKDFDLNRIFRNEGVQILHISGLVAALSTSTGKFCLELAKIAKKHGTRVAFDINHRPDFWEGREKELRRLFRRIARLADILIGNEEDFQLALGIKGPEAGGKDIAAKINAFKDMIKRAKKVFPNVSVFANTLRQTKSANSHIWGAIMTVGGKWYEVQLRDIDVLDRIGGGDAFVGGLLYAILKGWEPEKWIQFAWACGALDVTFLTDYLQPFDEKQIWKAWEGDTRIKR